MKLSNSQLRQIIQEEATTVNFQQLMEARADKRLQELNNPELLSEATIEWGEIKLETNFAKWAAVTGVTSTVCTTAITIASMFAGWEGVAIVLIPALAALAANPIVVAIAGATVLKFKLFKPIKEALVWLFKKIGGKTAEKIGETVQQIIDKMVEKSGGKLSRENAMELYGMIAKFIVSNSEFRSKIKELVKAMMKNNQGQISMISAQLDDLVETIIKRDILGISEKDQIDVEGAPEEDQIDVEGAPKEEEELEEPIIAEGRIEKLLLAAVGALPGVGNAVDVVAGIHSLKRKEYFLAFLRFVSAIPAFGQGAAAARALLALLPSDSSSKPLAEESTMSKEEAIEDLSKILDDFENNKAVQELVNDERVRNLVKMLKLTDLTDYLKEMTRAARQYFANQTRDNKYLIPHAGTSAEVGGQTVYAKRESRVRITQSQLRQIINEELQSVLSEKQDCFEPGRLKTFQGKSRCIQKQKNLSKKKADAYVASVLRNMGELDERKKKRKKKKKKKAKKLDRCARIAKRKYKVWPSAYASGAAVKCRQGKIWKGLKEEEEADITPAEEEKIKKMIVKLRKSSKGHAKQSKDLAGSSKLHAKQADQLEDIIDEKKKVGASQKEVKEQKTVTTQKGSQ